MRSPFWRAPFLATSLMLLGAMTVPTIAGAIQSQHLVSHTSTLPTLAQLKVDLVAAQTLSTFPSSLQPELLNNLVHQAYAGPCTSDKAADTTVIVQSCAFGQTASVQTVVLYGDSFASMWQPALSALGSADNFKLILVARLNCPFASLPKSNYKDPNCAAWKVNAVKYINTLHPSVVVFSEKNVGSIDPTSPTASVTTFATGIKTAMGQIHTAEKVVLLGMPYVHYNSSNTDDPGTCISLHQSSLTKCDTPIGNAFVAARLTADTRAVKAVSGAKVVSITPLVCGPVNCPVVAYDNGTPYIDFSNEFHISKWYSGLLGTALGTVFVNSRVTGL